MKEFTWQPMPCMHLAIHPLNQLQRKYGWQVSSPNKVSYRKVLEEKEREDPPGKCNMNTFIMNPNPDLILIHSSPDALFLFQYMLCPIPHIHS